MNATLCSSLLLAMLTTSTSAAVDYGQYIRWAGAAATSTPILSTAIDGSFAVATAGATCRVANIGVDGYPVWLGELPITSATTRVLDLKDGIAYLEDDATLTVIDLTEPMRPAPVGFLPLPGVGGRPGVVLGDRLYLARGTAGLLVIDVSVRSGPVLTNLLYAGESVTDVALANGRLVLLSNAQTLRVLSLANPDQPALLGAINLPAQPGEMDAEGDLLAVSNLQNDRVQLFDLSNPAAITLKGSVALPLAPDHLELRGQRLVVTRQQLDEAYELLVIDVGNPTAPVVVGGCGTPAEPWDVHIEDAHIVVAGGSAGLGIVSLGLGASPPVTGTWSGAFATARGLDVVGSRAYFLEGALGRVHILDVTNPAAPVRLGGMTTLSSNTDLACNGSLLGITVDLSGVDFWDVTNPAAPSFRARYDTQRARRVAWVGTRAYVADDFGLYVLNLSNPVAPTLLGSLHTAGIAVDVAVNGNTVYLAGQEQGVYVVNVTNPAAPSLIGTLDTPGSANGLAVRNAQLAVADGLFGLRLYDVASPPNPVLRGVTALPGNALEVSIDGDMAYVADDASMLAVDLTQPESAFVAGCGLPWDTIDLVASGGQVFCANASYGLRIVPQHLPPATAVEPVEWAALRVVPNPSPGAFVVSWGAAGAAGAARAASGPSGAQAARGITRWTLFDGGGRRIDGATTALASSHRFELGPALSAGVYFVIAEAGRERRVGRVTLVR